MSNKISVFEPYGITSFCEDIRHESSGQISLIGIYTSDIIVPDFPFIIPKFGISLSAVMPPLKAQDYEIDFLVFLPGDTDKASISIKNNVLASQVPPAKGKREADIPPHAKIGQQFIISPLELVKPGFIKVRFKLNDMYIKAGFIRVRSQDDAINNPDKKLEIRKSGVI